MQDKRDTWQMWCFELLALPLWYGRTVCSFCGNYLFKKLESWGWCVVSDTQERESFSFFFFFLILFWSSSMRAVIFPVFPFFSLWFFDGNITSKIKHKGFSFHSPTQHVIENVCLNLWTFSTTFSPAPLLFLLLLLLFSSSIKFTLVYFFTIWLLYSGRVQSHSQVPH